MEADLARIEATLLSLSNDVRGDISRLEAQLDARVSLDTQHETVARLHARIDSIADQVTDLKHSTEKSLTEIKQAADKDRDEQQRASAASMRVSVATLLVILGAVVTALYMAAPV